MPRLGPPTLSTAGAPVRNVARAIPPSVTPPPTRNQVRMQGVHDIQQARNQFYQHREANRDTRQARRASNRASR